MTMNLPEVLCQPNVNEKNKLLEQNGDSIGGSTDMMLFLEHMAKFFGTPEKDLDDMRNNPTRRMQVLSWFKSMLKDFNLSAKDRIWSDSSTTERSFSCTGEMPPNYALGSLYLPRTNSTCPEYAIGSHLPQGDESEESFRDSSAIVLPELYGSASVEAGMQMEETPDTPITDSKMDDGDSEDAEKYPMDGNDANMEMTECNDFANKSVNHDFMPFYHECLLLSSSPNYPLNANVGPENDIHFDLDEKECDEDDEVGNEEEEETSPVVSPVLLCGQHPSPAPEIDRLENISVRIPHRSTYWDEVEKDSLCDSSPTTSKEFDEAVDDDDSDEKILMTTLLDEAYYDIFEDQLTNALLADRSPVYDPRVSPPHSGDDRGSSQHCALASPCSSVSESIHGSETDIRVLDFVHLGSNTQDMNEFVNEVADIGPAAKRMKIDQKDFGLLTLPRDIAGSYPARINCLDQCIKEEDIVETNPLFQRDYDGDIPLHIAVAQEDLKAVEVCVQLMDKEGIDTANNDQQTALHLASYSENCPIMDLLLQAGADPEKVDEQGNNIMHIGCMTGSTGILQLLEKHLETKPYKLHAMLGAHNYEGFCPLHVAVKTRLATKDPIKKLSCWSAIEFLLQKLNCSLDYKELKGGSTVLMMAVEAQDWELVDEFVVCGADLNVSSHAELLALDYVAHTDNLKLAEDLIARGALSGGKNEFSSIDMKTLFDNDKRRRRRQGKKRTKTQRKE